LLWRALSLEEESCRVFLMLTLGFVRRKQSRWDETERIALEALQGAEREKDLAAQAQAWLLIAESRAGRDAFTHAADLFDAAGMAEEAQRVRGGER
jgi:predicted AAA+ superfamily ATPase